MSRTGVSLGRFVYGKRYLARPDLTPSAPISIERRDLAMAVGDAGRFANAENLLSQCRRFLLTREEATWLVKEMQQRVKTTWYQVARQAGVSERGPWSWIRPEGMKLSGLG